MKVEKNNRDPLFCDLAKERISVFFTYNLTNILSKPNLLKKMIDLLLIFSLYA